MPNWVDIHVNVSGKPEDVKKFLDKHIVDSNFDFETIIPSPKTIEECPKNCIVNGQSHIVEDDDKPWFDWYTWRCKYWGVKWNACETSFYYDEDNGGYLTIFFQTPWGTPDPIFEELGRLYPNLTIEISWIEEQGTEYLGRITYENGKLVEEYIPDSGSKEAYEMMFEMWDNRDSYVYDTQENTYVYIGNDCPGFDDDIESVYDDFCDDWKQQHGDSSDEEMPSIEEWYNNQRLLDANSN